MLNRFRRIFTSDLKPVYAYSIVLGLLLVVYFVVNFVDMEKLVNPWGALVLSVVPAGPPSAMHTEDTPEQAGSSHVSTRGSLKGDDSDSAGRNVDYAPVHANKSDRELSNLLPGRWIGSAVMHNNRTKDKVEFTINNILYTDGRFESITLISDGKILTYSGKWRVSNGNMVWETLNSNQPSSHIPYTETNRIIEMNEHLLVLQEKGFQSKWVKE